MIVEIRVNSIKIEPLSKQKCLKMAMIPGSAVFVWLIEPITHAYSAHLVSHHGFPYFFLTSYTAK
jgi:hypothetical protein